MAYTFLLCDLDETLYPSRSGLMQAVTERINRYMVEQMGFTPEVTQHLRRAFHEQYGTTLRGLIVNYGIDPEGYLAFVHDLPLMKYLAPDPTLGEVLGNIPLRKVVFTNASREHAEGVLNILGVRHHFERIIDVRDFHYHSKPDPLAYQRMLELLATTPGQCIFVEDSLRNLAPARALGMATVWVGDGRLPEAQHDPPADLHIENIHALAEAVQTLSAPRPGRRAR